MSINENPSEAVKVEAGTTNGLKAPPGVTYRLKVGNDRLEFSEHEVDDPVPTGRQVLEATGRRPVVAYLLFAMTENGALAEVRMDETVDLAGGGVKWFVVFKSDRSYRFVLDDRRIEWGAVTIRGDVLKVLAGVDLPTRGVWMERQAHPDRLLADDEGVSLDADDIERFWTGPVFELRIEGRLYSWPRDTITTEEIAKLGGWNPSDGVIEVNEDQVERQLLPDETVTLHPGASFGKILRWKRG